MFGPNCDLLLGTMIPKSGGDYAYLHESYGRLPGFLYLWCSMFVMIPATICSSQVSHELLQSHWFVCFGMILVVLIYVQHNDCIC